MKTLQNNFTTPEQSKRLLKLGVPADSADCIRVTRTDMVFFIPEEKNTADYLETYNTERDEKAEPCWSVGQLIEIFEICTGETFERLDIYNIFSDIFTTIESALLNHKMDFSKLEE